MLRERDVGASRQWVTERAHLLTGRIREHRVALRRRVELEDPEHHESMRAKLRVNREILAAWREEFGEDDGTESVTQAGDV